MKADHIRLCSLLYLAVCTSAAEVVDISYTSQGYPHFYLGDTITFSCTATGFSNIIAVLLVYNDTGTGSSGCGWDKVNSKWDIRTPPYIEHSGGIESPVSTNEYCGSVGKAAGFTFTAEVTITDKSARGKFYCSGFESVKVLSSEVPVTSVKVAPTNLLMFISPEEPVETQPFVVVCNSSDANPVSVYKYGIKRGDILLADNSTYTPTTEDRKGINVTCTDEDHPNWKGGDTEKTLLIQPKYIDAVGQTSLSARFNPKSTESSLNCAEHVTGQPEPHFRWTGDGTSDLDDTTSTLTLSPKEDGAEESVKCSANNGIGKTVDITWTITWTSEATIPTKPTTPNSGANVAAIVGVVAASLVLVIVIVGVV